METRLLSDFGLYYYEIVGLALQAPASMVTCSLIFQVLE